MRSSRKERGDDEKRSSASKEQSRSTSRDKTSLTSAKRTAGSNDKSCHACGAHFGLLHRKHDCRQCGNHFCSACSDNLILTPAGIPVRACDACREKHDAKRQQEQANKKMSREEDEEDALIAELVDDAGEGSKVDWAKLPPGKERRMARENELTQEAFSLLDDKWQGGSKLVAEHKANNSVTDGKMDKKGTAGGSQTLSPNPEGAKALRDAAQKLRVDCVKFKEAGMSEAATKAFRKAKELQRQADVLEQPPLPPPPPPGAKDEFKVSKDQKEKKQAVEGSSQGKAKKDEDEEVMKSLRELGWSDEKAEGKGGRVGQLEAQAKAHRRAALQFKKEGKRVEALEELRKAKVLDARAEEAELLGDDGDEDDLILGEVEDDDEDADLRKLMKDHEREEASRTRRGLGGKEDGGGGIDMSILAALRDDDEDDDGDGEEVEVGDADLHDPVMNAMLKEMGWRQEGEEGGQAVRAAKSELGAARLAGLKAAAVGFAETKAQLEEDIMAGKRKAGMLKREGKLQEAVVELRKAKAMEKELNEMDTSAVAGAGQGERQGGDVSSRQKVEGASDRLLDMSAIHKLMAGGEEEEEEEVEVTEDDEDDPDMKAALQAMGFVEEPPKPKAPVAAKVPVQVMGKGAQNVKKEPKSLAPLPAAPAVAAGQGEGMRDWEGQAMALKREAVALKRGGDLRGASEKLRQAKGLEKQAEEERAMRAAVGGQQEEEEEEEEEEVEVTEEDENDPEMMAALSAMGWQEKEKEKEKEKGREPVRNPSPSPHSVSSERPSSAREKEGLVNKGAGMSSRLDEVQTMRADETRSARQQSVVGAGGIMREGYGGGGTRSRPPPVGEEAFWDGLSPPVVKDVPRGMEGPPEGQAGVVREVKESFMDIRAAPKTNGSAVGGSERVEAIAIGSSLQNRQEVKQKTGEASGSFGRAGWLGGDKEQSLEAGGSSRDGEVRLEGQAGPSLEDMSVEIMSHKRKALAYKREGKLQEARQELAVAKQLEGQVASRQAQGGKEEGGGLGMAAVPPPPPPPPVSAPHTSSTPREAVREESGVEKQILDLKRKAVALKREGRLEEAVQALKQAKALGIEQGQGGATRKEGDTVGARGSVSVTAKPQAKAAPVVRRRVALRPAVVLDDDDDDLDEDEEAKLDALLFGNLQSLGLMAGGNTKSAPAPTPSPPTKTKAALASAATAPPPSSKSGGEAPLSAADRRKVEDQIKSFKVRAVQMKRGGNNAEALDALRSAKRLEAQIASLK